MSEHKLDYTKLSDLELADFYAIAKRAHAAEDKRVKALAGELVRRGKAQYFGKTYTVVKVEGGSQRFSSEAFIAEQGQAAYDKHKAFVPSVSWVPSLNDATTAALAQIGAAPSAS